MRSQNIGCPERESDWKQAQRELPMWGAGNIFFVELGGSYYGFVQFGELWYLLFSICISYLNKNIKNIVKYTKRQNDMNKGQTGSLKDRNYKLWQ